MGLRLNCKSVAATVLIVNTWGHPFLLADGKFIVQPKRQAAVAKPEVASEPSGAELAPSIALNPISQATRGQSDSAIPASHSESMSSVGAAQQLELSSLSAPPTATVALPRVPQTSAAASMTARPTQRPTQLKWIARGAVPPVPLEPQNVGPLEFSNPSSVTQPAVAESPAATTNSNPWTGASQEAALAIEEKSPKAILASLVSSQIILGRPAVEEPGRAVQSIDTPPGWQAVGQELSQRIANCEALLNRKAYFSAREDAEAAMLYLVRVLDLMFNQYRSEPAWHAACKAMAEAEDFSTAQRLTSDSDFLRRIILSHETPVLKDADVTTLAPLAAAQHYRQYAENKLVEASQGHPWASEVIYALGRTYQAEADASNDGSEKALRWKAVALYRGARAISPSNALAANQLGYVFLQMDRPSDAREALVASIQTSPSIAAFENLAEASRRMGDAATGNWALQQTIQMKRSQPNSSPIPPVVEVDPRTFAALSPYSIGPSPQSGQSGSQSVRSAALPSSPNNY